jgi:hypothetical protein
MATRDRRLVPSPTPKAGSGSATLRTASPPSAVRTRATNAALPPASASPPLTDHCPSRSIRRMGALLRGAGGAEGPRRAVGGGRTGCAPGWCTGRAAPFGHSSAQASLPCGARHVPAPLGCDGLSPQHALRVQQPVGGTEHAHALVRRPHAGLLLPAPAPSPTPPVAGTCCGPSTTATWVSSRPSFRPRSGSGPGTHTAGTTKVSAAGCPGGSRPPSTGVQRPPS